MADNGQPLFPLPPKDGSLHKGFSMTPALPLGQPVPGMPAAIYARVSRPKQKEFGYSLETQLPACLAYAQQYQFPVNPAHIFVDDESGTLIDRPGFLDLRDLVHQQVVKLVIVYKLDRFMRDYAYQLWMMKEFAAYGVQVLDTTIPPQAPSPQHTFLVHLLGAVSEFERTQILERTERGRRGRAAAGHPWWRAPLGYRYVSTGKKTGHYVIDLEEATLVLQIYQWCVQECLTLHQICARLNREHVPTPHKRRGIKNPRTAHPGWRPSAVYHLLTNDDYLGTQHYGKTFSVPHPKTPKKTLHLPTEPDTWTAIPIPPLVPRALFDAAAQQLAANALQSLRKRKHAYLLSGQRLRCDRCRLVMRGLVSHGRRVYCCRPSPDGLHTRTCRTLHAAAIEPQIWAGICDLARHPEKLQEVLTSYRQTVGPVQIAQDRATLEADLAKTQRALGRLVDLYINREDDEEPLPKALYLRKKKALDQESALYQTQLLALRAQEEAMAGAQTHEADLRKVLATVNGLLDEATTLPQQQRILDMMGATVYYTPEGTYRLELAPHKRPELVAESVFPSNTSRSVGTKNAAPLLLTWTLVA